jgi:membrane protein involved in colicin uptake
MLDVFKARLKAITSAAGVNLSQKRIDAIADRLNKKFPDPKDDAEHDTAIDSLYDATDLKEFAQVDDYQRTKEAKEKKDKEDADKKAADEARKKAEEDAKKTGDNEEPAWFKAYREATDAKLSAFEKEKKQGTIKQQLADKLKDVPASIWSKRQLPESEDAIEAFITEVQEDYKTDFVDKGLITPAPGGSKGGNNGKATKEEVAGIIDKILPK